MANIYTDTGFTLVTTADKIIYTVDNQPHDDLMSMLTNPVCGINTHHNRNFQHDGDLEIDGDLLVSGGLFEIDSDNTVVRDNNITINRGQPDQHNSGFIISSSAGTISYLETNVDNLILAGGKAIAYENSHGAISLLADATAADDAVPVSQAQAIVYTRPTSSGFPSPSAQYIELSLPLGAWQVVIENYGNTKLISNTWSTLAGTLNASGSYLGGAGIRNYALAIGGTSGGSYVSNATEYWNSASWVNTASLNESRVGGASCGIVNAATIVAGITAFTPDYSITAENFNGFVWAIPFNAPLNPGAAFQAGCGVQNAMLVVGGSQDASYGTTLGSAYKIYNNQFWSSTNGLAPAGTYGTKGVVMGTQNACIFAGFGTSISDFSNVGTQIFNGAAGDYWCPGPSLNSARQVSLAGAGVLNNCMIFGGMTTSSAAIDTVERFNGFVWITESSINATRKEAAGAGSQQNALLFGGSQSTTEQYLGEIPAEYSLWIDTDADSMDGTSMSVSSVSGCEVVAEVIQGENTGSTDLEKNYISELLKEDWNSGYWTATGALPTSGANMMGFGTPNATIAAGGTDGTSGNSYRQVTWAFNGATWSSLGNLLNTGRQSGEGTGCYNAGLAYGGEISPSGARTNLTEKWNGSAWSNSGNMGANRADHAGCGVQNAALAIAGTSGARLLTVEKFDGSSWNASTSIEIALNNCNHSAFGVWNAAIHFGGDAGSNAISTARMFNGTSWFLAPNTNQATINATGAGKYNNGIKVGGEDASFAHLILCEKWNGLLWYITGNTLDSVNGRYRHESSSGTGNTSIIWGGNVTAPVLTTTEIYRSGNLDIESRMTIYAYK